MRWRRPAPLRFDLGGSGTGVADWLGPIGNGVFANDGGFPDGAFRFNLGPAGFANFADFAALQAGGIETSGVPLTQPIFANGSTPPAI